MEDKKKELQQKFIALQVLHQQMQQIQQQVQAIEQQVAEVEQVQQSLEELSQVKTGTEALVPMSSGIFVKTKLEDTSKVQMNVGGGTVVDKSIPDAKKMLADQVIEMRSVQKEITKNLEELQKQAVKVEAELSEITE